MIYLDNAATTRPLPEVIDAMMSYLTDKWYNPSSSYQYGQEVMKDIEKAREFFARSINAESPDEIYFVSCGSEANNWALRGWHGGYPYIITDNIEHHSVLNAMNTYTGALGQKRIVKANKTGCVDIEGLIETIENIPNKDSLSTDIIISTMWLNNEIGTIQPIKLIGDIAKKYNAFFHVDAVQSFGKLPLDVQKYNISMLSTSSHKIGAPRGSGFLYVRKGTPLKPLIYGGQQERHMRAGTENVAGIMGFKKATEIALEHMEENTAKLYKLKDYFISTLDKINSIDIINRHMNTFPSTISVDFGVPAEAMMAYFDQFNIAVSSGSACNSRDDTPSHVLMAIGLSPKKANRVIRFSFSPDITEEQLDYVTKIAQNGIEVLKQCERF